jgi:CheY-like chemotaxis protein
MDPPSLRWRYAFAKPALAMPKLAESVPPAPPAEFDLAWPGVALCEPDVWLRALLREWLGRAAFEPARGAAPAALTPVVLVVADVPAPRQSGAAYVATLRSRFPQAKVLAISAQFMPGTRGSLAAATALGADAVLAKPFSFGMFIDTVRALVKV